jgi:hypothetical protein
MAGLSFFTARLKSVIPALRFLYLHHVRGLDPPTAPHLDDEAAAWLEQQLPKTRLFLEYGSGGSTVLANRLGVPTISVESDRFYAETVQSVLPKPESTRMLVPPMGLTEEWGMPAFFKRKKGRRYVMAPFELLNDRFPDLVMIDGRYRVAAALESARRAARMGSSARLMLDDYAGRPHYHVLETYLGEPERIGRAALFVIGRTPVAKKDVEEFVTDPR